MKTIMSAAVILMLQFNVFAQEGVYSFDSTQILNDSVFGVFPDYFPAAGSTDTMGISGNWSKDYTIPGISGTIYTTATDGTNLYVGGRFRIAGNVIANNIAKWDGQSWTSIGEGPENGVYGYVPTVHALAFADGKLFAGGQFSKAGSVDVNGIAYWDGEAWNSMGTDSTNGVRRIVKVDSDTLILQGFIWSLFSHGDKIYAGGWYQLAGNDTTNGIAAWDLKNERWESLDGGFSTTNEAEPVTAYAFTADSSYIYMGGQFTSAGKTPAKNIAAWDGQNWLPVGDFSYSIRQLSLDQDGNLLAVVLGNPVND
jgi:trimeric autotransporter adhesin